MPDDLSQALEELARDTARMGGPNGHDALSRVAAIRTQAELGNGRGPNGHLPGLDEALTSAAVEARTRAPQTDAEYVSALPPGRIAEALKGFGFEAYPDIMGVPQATRRYTREPAPTLKEAGEDIPKTIPPVAAPGAGGPQAAPQVPQAAPQGPGLRNRQAAVLDRIQTSRAELEARTDPRWSDGDDGTKLGLLNAARSYYGQKPLKAVPQPLTMGGYFAQEAERPGGIIGKVPFIGGVAEAVDLYQLHAAASRLEDGTATLDDWETLAAFQEQQVRESRDKTLPASVAAIVAESVPWMVEFAATGGLLAAGRKALGKGARELGERAAARTLSEAVGAAIASTARGVAETVPRTLAAPQRIAAETIRRMIPDYELRPGDDRALIYVETDPGDGFTKALAKGVAGTAIEVFSETTGQTLSILGRAAGKPLLRIPGGKMVQAKAAVVADLMAKRGWDLSQATRFLQTAGWHGILAEVGEERVGELLRAAAQLEPYQFPTARELTSEFLAFGVIGAGGAAAGAVAPRPRPGAPIGERDDEFEAEQEKVRQGREEARVGEESEGEIEADDLRTERPPGPGDAGLSVGERITPTTPYTTPPTAAGPIGPVPGPRWRVEERTEEGGPPAFAVVEEGTGVVRQVVPSRVIAQEIADELSPPGTVGTVGTVETVPQRVTVPPVPTQRERRVIGPYKAEQLLALENDRDLVTEALKARGYDVQASPTEAFATEPGGRWRYRITGTAAAGGRVDRFNPTGRGGWVRATGKSPSVKQFAKRIREELAKPIEAERAERQKYLTKPQREEAKTAFPQQAPPQAPPQVSAEGVEVGPEVWSAGDRAPKGFDFYVQIEGSASRLASKDRAEAIEKANQFAANRAAAGQTGVVRVSYGPTEFGLKGASRAKALREDQGQAAPAGGAAGRGEEPGGADIQRQPEAGRAPGDREGQAGPEATGVTVPELLGPEVAAKGMAYVVYWADGRARAGFRRKNDAIAFAAERKREGDLDRKGVVYEKRPKGMRLIRKAKKQETIAPLAAAPPPPAPAPEPTPPPTAPGLVLSYGGTVIARRPAGPAEEPVTPVPETVPAETPPAPAEEEVPAQESDLAKLLARYEKDKRTLGAATIPLYEANGSWWTFEDDAVRLSEATGQRLALLTNPFDPSLVVRTAHFKVDDPHPMRRANALKIPIVTVPRDLELAPGVTLEDLPFDTLVRAKSGTSMVPEERAHSRQRQYVQHMAGIWTALLARAQTAEQRQTAEQEFGRFRGNYITKERELLARESGLMSTMVTGPARFPVRSQQKKQGAYAKALNEFLAWEKRATHAMQEAVNPTTPRAVSADRGDAVEVLEKKIADARRLQEAMTDGNRIVRSKKMSDEDKVAALVTLGLTESNARAALKPDYMGRKGFPAFELQNNLANIKRMEQRVREISENRERGERSVTFDGGRVLENPAINRVQIFFNAKPDAAMRDKLKSRGFKWAPTEGAWQRQNTVNARAAVRELLGVAMAAGEAATVPAEPTGPPGPPSAPKPAPATERVDASTPKAKPPEELRRAEPTGAAPEPGTIRPAAEKAIRQREKVVMDLVKDLGLEEVRGTYLIPDMLANLDPVATITPRDVYGDLAEMTETGGRPGEPVIFRGENTTILWNEHNDPQGEIEILGRPYRRLSEHQFRRDVGLLMDQLQALDERRDELYEDLLRGRTPEALNDDDIQLFADVQAVARAKKSPDLRADLEDLDEFLLLNGILADRENDWSGAAENMRDGLIAEWIREERISAREKEEYPSEELAAPAATPAAAAPPEPPPVQPPAREAPPDETQIQAAETPADQEPAEIAEAPPAGPAGGPTGPAAAPAIPATAEPLTDEEALTAAYARGESANRNAMALQATDQVVPRPRRGVGESSVSAPKTPEEEWEEYRELQRSVRDLSLELLPAVQQEYPELDAFHQHRIAARRAAIQKGVQVPSKIEEVAEWYRPTVRAFLETTGHDPEEAYFIYSPTIDYWVKNAHAYQKAITSGEDPDWRQAGGILELAPTSLNPDDPLAPDLNPFVSDPTYRKLHERARHVWMHNLTAVPVEGTPKTTLYLTPEGLKNKAALLKKAKAKETLKRREEAAGTAVAYLEQRKKIAKKFEPKPGLAASVRHDRSPEERLRAIAPGAAKESTRYAINWILVTPDAMVVTDGRRLWKQRAQGNEFAKFSGAAYTVGAKGAISKVGDAEKDKKTGHYTVPGDDGGSFPKFESVIPEKQQHRTTIDVQKTYQHVRLASIMAAERSEKEGPSVAVLLNQDGSLGFAASTGDLGTSEINVSDGAVPITAVNPAFLMDQLEWHYADGADHVEFGWTDANRPMTTETPTQIGVLMPVNIEWGRFATNPNWTMQSEVDSAEAGIVGHGYDAEEARQAGFRPAFRQTATGEVFDAESAERLFDLARLPKKLRTWTWKFGVHAVEENFASGWKNPAGEFVPLHEAGVAIALQKPTEEIARQAGLDVEGDPAAGQVIDAYLKAWSTYANDQSKDIDTRTRRRREYSDAWDAINRLRDRGSDLRQTTWESLRPTGGMVGMGAARQVALRNLLSALVRKLQSATPPAAVEPPSSPDAEPTNYTADELKFIREQGENRPTFGMGAAANIPDVRNWWQKQADKIIGKMLARPELAGLARGIMGTRWGMGEREYEQFRKVHGEKQYGLAKLQQIEKELRAGVKERQARAAAEERTGPVEQYVPPADWQSAANTAQRIRREYHRELEDVFRGRKPIESLDERQRKIFELFAGPVRAVTDYYLDNEWTHAWLEKFGFPDVLEVIKAKRKGPGVYLRQLYELEGDYRYVPIPERTQKRQTGPMLRGGMFLPKRGDEQFFIVIDETAPPTERYAAHDTRKEAERAVEAARRAKKQQYGEQVNTKIRVLDPFDVEGLEKMVLLEEPSYELYQALKSFPEDVYVVIDKSKMSTPEEQKQSGDPGEPAEYYIYRSKPKAEAAVERLAKQAEERKPGSGPSVTVLSPEEVRLARAPRAKPTGLKAVRDVEVLMTRTLLDSLHNLQTLKLFKMLNDTVASDPRGPEVDEAAGLRRIPDDPAFGPLAGRAVPEPVAYAIFEWERVHTGFWSAFWDSYLYAWKSAKVPWSLATWGRNIQGMIAFWFLDRGGVHILAQIPEALRELKQRGPAWEALVKAGKLQVGWGETELRSMEAALKEHGADWPKAVQDFAVRHPNIAEFGKRAGEKVSAVNRRVGRLYDLPDQLTILASYLHKTRGVGMSHEEAIRNLWMYPNYGELGRLAKWARRAPLGAPFVAFTDQAIKIWLRAARDRPIRLLALTASVPLLNLAARMILGLDDDDMKVVNSDRRRQGSWVNRFYQPLLPMRGADGRPLWIDLRWVYPLAADLRISNQLGGFSVPFLFSQPWMTLSQEFIFNRDDYTGRELWPQDATMAQRLATAGKRAAIELAPLPPLVLKTGGGGFVRIMRSLTGESLESPARAVAREVFGVSIRDAWASRETAFKMIRDSLGAGQADEFARLMTLYNDVYRRADDPRIRPAAVRRSLRESARRERQRELAAVP